jgi:hypothetical protein
MPGGDRTGPLGLGPGSGRAAGYCAGYGMPGYANPAFGQGFRMGSGRGRGGWNRNFAGGGRGWRNQYYATGLPGWARFGWYAAPNQKPEPEIEKQVLRNQAQTLQSELDLIRKRLSEIESGTVAG